MGPKVHLILKNVRCFANPAPARLAPLTILVGENSSGKSSFLALHRIAHEIVRGRTTPNFNQEPFFLGAYDQIAHFRGGPRGRSQSFEIGLAAETSRGQEATFVASFKKQGSQPSVAALDFSVGEHGFRVEPQDRSLALQVRTPIWSGNIRERVHLGRRGGFNDLALELRYLGYILSERKDRLAEQIREQFAGVDIPGLAAQFGILSDSWGEFQNTFSRIPYALAPVRTKPRRTYDPVDDTPTPEGDHVPMVLAKMRFTDRKSWDRIRQALNTFGLEAGLFEEIKLKSLGRSDSDPFQILLKIGGPWRNLIDVGYGVSQVLPIVVDLVRQQNGNVYLLQQPEVHLHPRGQAALGSFLCEFIASTESQVVVETHSDHLIDRVRIAVREGRTLSAKDVSILFFERRRGRGVIHQLALDEKGNLLNAPPSYRKFFLEEENLLLGL